MIAVYALGGGLGHLTRVRALLHTLGTTEPVTIISTAGAPALDTRVVGDAAVVTLPPDLARRGGAAGVRAAVATVLQDVAPSTFVVDAFPAGILGELDATAVPAGTHVVHTARNLRWDEYEPVLPDRPLHLGTTFVVEPLDPRHLDHLRRVSGRVEELDLQDPTGPARARDGRPVTLDDVLAGGASTDPGARRAGAPRWLVVHSGPVTETDELVAYARAEADREGLRPHLVVVTPGPADPPATATATATATDGDGPVIVVDAYPAAPLMRGADRVFTGGGSNAVREVIAAGAEHRALPFPRRFDDQAARLARTVGRRTRPSGPDRPAVHGTPPGP